MVLSTRVQRFGDPLELAQREFDILLGRFFGNGINGDGGEYVAPYGVDVREDADHIYVEAELPGFKKDEVDINIENQTLTISAEHKESNGESNGESNEPNVEEKKGDEKSQWLLRERRYARFQRSFTLPPTVDPQTVQAKLTDGVLLVTLNKREETKPRRIAVS